MAGLGDSLRDLVARLQTLDTKMQSPPPPPVMHRPSSAFDGCAFAGASSVAADRGSDDGENVWAPLPEPPVPPAAPSHQCGGREPPTTWVVAEERVRNVGNGRKVHDEKLVHKRPGPGDKAPATPATAGGRRWTGVAHRGPPDGGASPTIGTPYRTTLVAGWVADMRRQYSGRHGAYDESGGTALPDVANDGHTEVTADREQRPTLLNDPAVNNNRLPATEPTGPLHRLQMQILTNFGNRCREEGQVPDEGELLLDTSPRHGHRCCCALADEFTMKPHHNRTFLERVLLPISRVASYDVMVKHVNTCVAERVYAERGVDSQGPREPQYDWAQIKKTAVYEDFRTALILVNHRSWVMKNAPVTTDRFGFLCDADDVEKESGGEGGDGGSNVTGGASVRGVPDSIW